jgi:hypothetical protein
MGKNKKNPLLRRLERGRAENGERETGEEEKTLPTPHSPLPTPVLGW